MFNKNISEQEERNKLIFDKIIKGSKDEETPAWDVQVWKKK